MPTVAADEVWETVIALRGQRSVLAPVHCLVVPNYDAGMRAQLFYPRRQNAADLPLRSSHDYATAIAT